MNRERMQRLAEARSMSPSMQKALAQFAKHKYVETEGVPRPFKALERVGKIRRVRTRQDRQDTSVEVGSRTWGGVSHARMITWELVPETGRVQEAYGDDPIQVIRNGMLGVARKRKYQKVKDKAERHAKVAKMVSKWKAALNTKDGAVIDWLVKKLD